MWNFLRFSLKFAFIRLIFLILGLVLIVFSWWREMLVPSDKSILYLIDNSLSMMVRDVNISALDLDSRLAIAKNFTHYFSEKISHDEAVASFSREITLETPFTSDKDLIKNVISGISPMVYGGGSNIYTAIDSIVNIYKTRQNLHIIVLTDAENFDTNTNIPKIPPYISLTFIGIGTEKWWPMLEWYTSGGQPSYRQFEGKNAISRLDKNTLEQLGKNFSSDTFILDSIDDFEDIFTKIFSKIETREVQADFYKIFGIFFLLFAIFFPSYIFLKNEKNT